MIVPVMLMSGGTSTLEGTRLGGGDLWWPGLLAAIVLILPVVVSLMLLLDPAIVTYGFANPNNVGHRTS